MSILISYRPDGSFVLGDEMGCFVDTEELYPWERTLGSYDTTKYRNHNKLDAKPYAELIQKLSNHYSYTKLEKMCGVGHRTLQDIADGTTSGITKRTAEKLELLML